MDGVGVGTGQRSKCSIIDNQTMDLVDFSSPASVNGWQPIDDRIMGGVSNSLLRYNAAGHAVFEGSVSADNGGGFASVRHPQLRLGTASTSIYRLLVLGDGHRYKLNLRTDQTFDGVNYQANFQPPAGQWTTIDIALGEFVAKFRGRTVPGAPPLAPARVCQLGLMIADRQWGPFQLGIKSIGCAAQA